MSDPKIVLNFWFNEIEPAQWWRKDPAFDAQLKQRFGQLHEDVAHTGALHWRDQATGRLAEVIVLDQFSRNLYRDDPRAFAWDAAALTLAEETIALALIVNYHHNNVRSCICLICTANVARQQRSLELFAAIAETGNLDSAQRHFDVINTFGRFPHRNAVEQNYPRRLKRFSQATWITL